jgi:hypothetical protein
MVMASGPVPQLGQAVELVGKSVGSVDAVRVLRNQSPWNSFTDRPFNTWVHPKVA